MQNSQRFFGSIGKEDAHGKYYERTDILYITLADLVQIGIFILALIALVKEDNENNNKK